MPYRDALVSYFDLLGFRNLIDTSKTDAAVASIARILDATHLKGEYNYGFLNMQGTQKLLADIFQFSDHIVRRNFPTKELDWERHISLELTTLSRIQWELLRFHKMPIRGGVSFDKMNAGHLLFGPCMVRSYDLEQAAIYPRLIIDHTVVSCINNLEAPAWANILARGEDGYYFLDYLNSQLRPNGMPAGNHGDSVTEILAEHKAIVLEKLKKYRAKKYESIRQKWLWVALYHNRTIYRLLDEYAEMAVLKPLCIDKRVLLK
jgi:hypothetical protein